MSPPTPTIAISGYVEAFYQYDVEQPSNLTTAYRGFDDRSSSFTIDNAVLDVTGTSGAVSARIALQVGHTPSAYYSSEPLYRAQAGTGESSADLWRLIQTALVAYKRGATLVEAGIFISPIGLEGIAIKDQWNWSRSNLFFALPYYHAGVKVTRPLSEHVTGAVMVTNGWNDVVNRNRYPCVAGLVTYAPSAEVSAQLLYFGGVEPPLGAPEGQPWRHLGDATLTWNATPDLAFAAQADAGYEHNDLGTSRWVDGAAYARVHPLPELYLAARADWMHERETGAAPRIFFPAGDVASGTLTLDVRPESNLSVRLEYRYDHASTDMYFHGDVAVDSAGDDVPNTRSQQTLTLGATAWF